MPLTNKESLRFRMKELVVEESETCQFLGKNGCLLKEGERPLVCQFFPLIWKQGQFVVFEGCEYTELFKNDMVVDTPQMKHYIKCLALIHPLTPREKIKLGKLYRNITYDS